MKVRKITDRKDYDLYTTDVTYDYSIDDIISSGITDTQSIIDAVIRLYRSWISNTKRLNSDAAPSAPEIPGAMS